MEIRSIQTVVDLRRPRSVLSPRAEVFDSPTAGKGIYAVSPIAAGELVAIWGGGVMTYDELMALPDEVNGYAVQIWEDLFVGPRAVEEIEPSDYFNHSCDPNCGLKGQLVVVARRDIAPGEELTYDYGTTDAMGPPMVCTCGTAKCRGMVTSDDWRDPAFRARHEGYLSAWIEELVRREARSGNR